MKSTLRGLDERGRSFCPSRFSLARKLRGLQKTELARLLGLSLKSVVNYERGVIPSEESVRRMADTLRLPESFFFGEPTEEINAGSASFRSMARMPASRRDEALGQGALCLLLNNWLSKRLALPQPSLPDLHLATPEAAAAILRTEWNLGCDPIHNMIHLLEAHGVRVFSLSVKAREVDAFSLWKDGTPFVMLNVQKTSEHSRFDAAHELGHLILHRQGAPVGKEAEGEANRFASAFLMPDADVAARVALNAPMSDLIELKRRWKVSLAALNYRLHTLGLSSDYHYRQACIAISTMGARTSEINGIPRETSLLISKALKLLEEDGLTRSHIAADLGVTVDELDGLIFGLVIASVPGGRRAGIDATGAGAKLVLVER